MILEVLQELYFVKPQKSFLELTSAFALARMFGDASSKRRTDTHHFGRKTPCLERLADCM